MKILNELLQLLEDTEIPPRVQRFLKDGGFSYQASSMEELRKQHAQQIVRRGGKKGMDAAEKGLCYTLGMNDMSDEEIKKLATDKSKAYA